MRLFWLVALLFVMVTGCASPSPAEVLGPEARLLAQTKADGAVVMLGALPSGEWTLAVSRGDGAVSQSSKPPMTQPVTFSGKGLNLVAGRAPEGAERWELLNEARQVLKGRVENGVYLIAWPTSAEAKPAFILRILDAKGDELYRWPPPGGLPAA